MEIEFERIALYSSNDSKTARLISDQLEEVLINLGVRILKPTSSALVGSNKKSNSDNFIFRNADLIVAIGGDGTLLSASRKFGAQGIPVLGVNLGKLGFLTDINPDELTSGFQKVLSGNYIRDNRFFIEASLSKERNKFIALNEAVIHSAAVAQLIEYEVYIDEVFVYRQRADGIIVSSPTGSTAYSLSGNGPIIHPAVKAISLLPMFPHSLNTRPLIIGEDSCIQIKICKKGKASLSLDSHKTIKLKQGDEINLCKSKENITLIHPTDHDFFSACRNKLGWSLGITNN